MFSPCIAAGGRRRSGGGRSGEGLQARSKLQSTRAAGHRGNSQKPLKTLDICGLYRSLSIPRPALNGVANPAGTRALKPWISRNFGWFWGIFCPSGKAECYRGVVKLSGQLFRPHLLCVQDGAVDRQVMNIELQRNAGGGQNRAAVSALEGRRTGFRSHFTCGLQRSSKAEI